MGRLSDIFYSTRITGCADRSLGCDCEVCQFSYVQPYALTFKLYSFAHVAANAPTPFVKPKVLAQGWSLLLRLFVFGLICRVRCRQPHPQRSQTSMPRSPGGHQFYTQ